MKSVSKPPILAYDQTESTPVMTPEQAITVFRCCRAILIACVVLIFALDITARLINDIIAAIILAAATLAGVAVAMTMWGRWMAEKRTGPQLAIVLACPVLITSLMVSNWGMRIGFVISEPALDRLADDVAAGRPVSLPVFAGTFRIQRVEVHSVPSGAEVALLTSDNESWHVGFVRTLPGVTPTYNMWTHWQLGARWHHFADD